jgi:23S rRNA (uracil1939-C5)-methyltransferase
MTKPTPPVSAGDLVTLDLEALVPGGEAIAHLGGFTLFVPGGVPGDRVTAEVISTKPSYGRALVKKVLTPGSQRAGARCPLFGRCGGCQWQEVDYTAQLQWKRHIVEDALTRIGGFPKDDRVASTMGMEDPWYYRNKVHWALAKDETPGGRGIRIGLYEARSHRVVDVEHCYIQHPLNNLVLDFLRKTLPAFDFPLYDERTGKGWLRSAFAKAGHQTNELMIGLVTTRPDFPLEDAWVEQVRAQFPGVTSIVQNVHGRPGNALMGEETRVLWGKDHLFEKIGPLTFAISARSFFQVNSEQVERLYETVVNFAGLKGGERIVDLYSGTGTIALYLAAKGAGEAVGIEVIPEATRDAIANARLNGIANAKFLTGKVEDRLERLLSETGNLDVAVLDPPRKGCEPEVIAAIAHSGIPRIVYVSCNPATLARDLKGLVEAGGYRLDAVQPVDMFPQTAHVEAVALLTKDR